MKQVSNFILLHVNIKLSQHHLVKSVFSYWISWHPFQKQLMIDIWIDSWTLNTLLLIYLYANTTFFYCSFVVSYKIGKYEPFNFVFLFQDYFDYSKYLTFPYEFEDHLFHFCEKCSCKFDRVTLAALYRVLGVCTDSLHCVDSFG